MARDTVLYASEGMVVWIHE